MLHGGEEGDYRPQCMLGVTRYGVLVFGQGPMVGQKQDIRLAVHLETRTLLNVFWQRRAGKKIYEKNDRYAVQVLFHVCIWPDSFTNLSLRL